MWSGEKEQTFSSRPVRALVNLSSIRSNVRYLKSLIPERCRFMAVVKANAYGHGDVPVSRVCLQEGADLLGVATVREAMKLRGVGIRCPIFLLFEPSPESAAEVVAQDLTCAVYTGRFARELSRAALDLGRKAVVHVKVDTGMRRVGIEPGDLGSYCRFLENLNGLSVEGIYTHFACADEPGNPLTGVQMRKFEEISAEAERFFGRGLVKHAANSAAILSHPRSHYDMVRAGISIYGLSPSPFVDPGCALSPALSIEGEVVFCKKVGKGEGVSYCHSYRAPEDTKIATLPIGYGDGYSRLFSGKADVLIGGKRRRVVGNVCMDMCMADVGEDMVDEGTVFIAVGRQGKEEITVDELADILGTINYEVLCMLDGRIPKVFLDPEEEEQK